MPPAARERAPERYPEQDSKMAQFLQEALTNARRNGKTQRQIAHEVGYKRPNIISMLKHGECKVPMEKVPALAKALDVDPATMTRLAIEQNWPEHFEEIMKYPGPFPSENEMRILQHIREAADYQDPAFTAKQLHMLTRILSDQTPTRPANPMRGLCRILRGDQNQGA